MIIMKKSICFILCVILTAMLCGCNAETKNETQNTSTPKAENAVTDIDISLLDLKFTDNDLNEKISGATEIKDETVKITDGGVYKVSGKHTQIIVEAGEKDKPRIILCDAEINCSDGPAINIISADKVFITIPENTTSSVSDATEYGTNYDNADGAVFSKSDLTVNGSGTLNIKGNYKSGIVSKDDLNICNTNINIESKGAAIEGKDCVKLNNAILNINADGDGIKSTNTESAERGFIYISSGKFCITSTNDAFQSETTLIIDSGDFNLKTGGGSAVSSSSGNDNGWGMWGKGYPRNFEDNTASDEQTVSAKALKSGVLIKISDGIFNIDSSDDAIHSNSDIEINDGEFNISSGDDGVHADDELLFNEGILKISKSYEGLEATVITVTGGNIDVTASDDGFNAAGGKDSSALGGRPGQNPFDSDSDASINIKGGYILVNASGDGIDSNGSITMDNGILLVSGPENNGNGAFDYGISADINGGTAVIVGSSGMAQGFSSSSKQASFMTNLNKTQNSGQSISIGNDNKIFASFIPSKAYSNIIISSPMLEIGKNYTVYLSGNVTNTDKNGYTENGKVSEESESVEISITSVSNSSGQGPMGGGDMMRPNGGHGGFGRP